MSGPFASPRIKPSAPTSKVKAPQDIPKIQGKYLINMEVFMTKTMKINWNYNLDNASSELVVCD